MENDRLADSGTREDAERETLPASETVKLKGYVKLVLLLSAYAPAVLIAGLLQACLPWTVALIAISIGLVGVLWLTLRRTTHGVKFDTATESQWTLHSPKTRESELAAFLLGYLLPFLQWSPTSGPLAWLALPALVAVVLFLNWHIGIFHLNPTLMLLGWRIVDMTEVNKAGDLRASVTVLCRGRFPGPDESLPAQGWRRARLKPPGSGTLWIAEFSQGTIAE
jgi:hypothetical protein